MDNLDNIARSEYARKVLEDSGCTLADIMTEDQLATLHTKSILSGEELFILPEQESEPIIDGILWKSDVMVLLAKEKVGKSIAAMQMACAITSGTPFLDQYDTCEPANVLYIQAEGARQDFIGRLRRMTDPQSGVKWHANRFFHMFPPSLALNNTQEFIKLAEDITHRGIKPKVIFFDPLYMTMSGSLKDDDVARAFCGNIRDLQNRFDCAVVIVHHENRGVSDSFGNKVDRGDDAIFVSFVRKAFPSHIFRMTKCKKDESRMMSCTTQRSSTVVEKIHLKLLGSEQSIPLKFIPYDTKVAASDITVLSYLKTTGSKGASAKGVEVATGLSVSNVRSSFRSLLDAESVYKINPKGCPVLYGVVK